MKRAIMQAIIITIAFCAIASAQEKASVTVRVDQAGIKVSPMLYGLFFEEINRAGDGGLYAEMIQNRSFEDALAPLGWSLVASGGAEARMELDKSQPLNAKNPTCLRLEIAKTGSGRAGIASDGFKGAPYQFQQEVAKLMPKFEEGAREFKSGIAVEKGKEYRFTMYARCGNEFGGKMTVSIEKQDGAALASQKISGIGAAWKKFECRLTAKATEPNARLIVSADSKGTVWLDMVSLFPKDTFKARENGMRADLAQILATMKPAFVRFPGGCWVEGDEMKFAYRWKDTIGDVAQRPSLWNRWGYNSTHGMGYHEYLQLCEDLGAEPLFVINCGMSHKENVPMDKMGEFVQDALDAIEYANGPADSRWGTLRSEAGHLAPFNLKYMEIGNENGGQAYQDRYPLFHDAIKKRYPDMHLILDYVPSKTRPSEIVDEHYYNTPEFFMRNADKYDKYDRAAHKVYVGEYAVTKGAGRGNLKAALGEAAFMTGLERNSDVVVMGSYAPLFEHVGWKRWNPNAILFDAARAYGTPSWQIQALFGQNRADVILPTSVTSPMAESSEQREGYIGVGTWNTQAEFKDIKVTKDGQTLFESDFGKDAKGWRFTAGNWKAEGGALTQSEKGQDLRAYAGKKEWKDYTLTLKARKTGGSEGFLISFASLNDKDKSWWNIGGWGNKSHGLEMRGVAAERVPGVIETGRWYDIKIEFKGPAIRCYLDGKLIHDVSAKGLPSLYAVAGMRRGMAGGAVVGDEMILKIVNVSAVPMSTAIDLKGAGKLAPSATALVLTSQSPDDENSFDQPDKVSVKKQAVQIKGPSFTYECPANSVSVLQIGAGR